MNHVNLTPLFIDAVESSAHLLQEAVFKHPLYKCLIEGTLTTKQFDFFVKIQAWIWYELSRNLLPLSRVSSPAYITSVLLKVANISLITADNFNDQVNNFKLETYKVPSVCKEYISFLRSLVDERLILLLLVALMPRFRLMSMLRQRYLKLKPLEHPYKKFIENCILLNAEEHITRIINTLDTQFQAISKEGIPKIQQVVLEAASHECELLNEAYSLVAI